MKNIPLIIILAVTVTCLLVSSGNKSDDVSVSREEAQKAFALLTNIRANPDRYSGELGYKPGIKVSERTLVWNDTLAKVAEAKAYDMAKRNYFSHVTPEGYGINYFINRSGYKLNSDWLTNKKDNYFESLAAGSRDGEDAIRQLIIDDDDAMNGYRHRIHLLGLDEWSSSLSDVGIGVAIRETGSEYGTYICVIIAKHDW